MANKTFNTRVKNKRDTAANWEAVATTFQPLDGELIIVDTSAGKTRFKVGRYDTAKGRLLYYNEIPFADEYLYNDLNESQGKIYDKLKGIDDKSIIEMTLESVFDNTKFINYRIGLWQFPKTGFYKLNISKRGTTATQLMLYAQKTKEDGTTPEDPFSQDNLLRISPLNGDKQVESVFVQVDYTDTDTLTVYKVQFLNVITFPGTININTYNKTTQKWDFTSITESNAKWANNATQVSNALTLTKGDATTKFDGSTAQTVSIPTKTSELTNDSFVSYAEQTLTEDQQNQAKTNLGIDVLTGNTTTVTPTQVKEAILAGRPIAITYVDNTYGNLTFTSFGYSLENNVVVANLVATANGQYILADLTGMSNTNSWTLQTTELGTSTDIANNYVKYSESQTLTDEQKTQARTNIGAISFSEVSSNYLSLDSTQVLTEIQQDHLKDKLGYINNLKVLSNWVGATEQCKKEAGCVLVIQYSTHNDGDTIPEYMGYPLLLIPNRVSSTTQSFHVIDAYGDNYACSFLYPSFKFNVSKMEMNQQKMKADPTEDMQIATKKYVDNSGAQSDWNQNDATAKDYIKNRICYTKDATETIVLNSTLSFTDISQQDKTVFSYQDTSSSIKFNEGTVYNVNFDSISYSCIAFTNTNIPNSVILGNLRAVSELSSTTNEPFVMVTDSKGSQGLQILTNLTGTSHSVKITEIHTEIIKLDKKYIPDDIFTSIENIDNKVEDFINNTQFLTKTDSVGTGSFSFNRETGSTVGENSATFGLNNIASGNNAFAEGAINKATGWNSHAEGNATTASGNAAHAEGLGTKATGASSHAEGLDTIASGNYSHTEGENTTAENKWSHAEGKDTNTKGLASHAEGIKTIAQGNFSHAEGRFTVALGENQHVEGILNIEDTTSLHIVGNGTYTESSGQKTKSNAHTLDKLGNAWFAGNVYVGSTSGTNKDDGSKKLATEEYVNNKTTTITVDDTLSNTSTNPVQNKVVKAAIDDLQASIDSKPSAADAVYTATAASTDGVAYTATVSGIDSLTVGASFIMIPNKASTSKAPTLNVNGLGAKPIRRRLSSLTTILQQGYSTNWIALNKPFTVVYDGTAWVIEGLTKTDGADVYGAVAQATADAKGNNIADTYATIAMLQSLLPKVTTITLTSNWVGDASPYYQDIALSCVTETSIVDLQPTPEQLNSWQDDGIAFTTLSGNGTVRVYVAGGKPSSAISVQVRVQEVTVI